MLPNDLKRAKSYSDHGSDLPRQERHQDAPAPASPPRSLGRQLMVGRRHRYLRNAAILTIIAVARLGSGIGLLSAAGAADESSYFSQITQLHISGQRATRVLLTDASPTGAISPSGNFPPPVPSPPAPQAPDSYSPSPSSFVSLEGSPSPDDSSHSPVQPQSSRIPNQLQEAEDSPSPIPADSPPADSPPPPISPPVQSPPSPVQSPRLESSSNIDDPPPSRAQSPPNPEQSSPPIYYEPPASPLSPPTSQPSPEQLQQAVSNEVPPSPHLEQLDCPPPPASPPAAADIQQQTGTSTPSTPPSPSPNYSPTQSPALMSPMQPPPSPSTPRSPMSSPELQQSSPSSNAGLSPPQVSSGFSLGGEPVETDAGSSALAQAPSGSPPPPSQPGYPPAFPEQPPPPYPLQSPPSYPQQPAPSYPQQPSPSYPAQPPPLAPANPYPQGPQAFTTPAATSSPPLAPEEAPPAASSVLSSPPAALIQSTLSSGFLQSADVTASPPAEPVTALAPAPPLQQHQNSTQQHSSEAPLPAGSLAPGSSGLPTATASSPGVDIAYTAQAVVPMAVSKVTGASQWPSVPVGGRIEPAPEVLAAIEAADISAGDKHLARGIATQKTCPPDTDAAVTVPLGGAMLASHSGHTCGTLPAVPQALTSLVSDGYELEVLGSRIGHTTGIVTHAIVSLAGGRNASTFQLPQAGQSNWTVSTAAGYNFTVNASALAVVLDGVSYAIPVRGFARDNSSISSGAGRRLLGRLAGHGASEAAADDIAGHDFMAKQLQPLHRRQLAQEPSSMYSIQLVISKCSSDLPVLGATVNALLSGFTAQQEPFPLQQFDNTSNIYSAPLDLELVFPNLAYSNQATVNFCTSNQASIETACAVGITNGLTFANTSVLLNACTQFLTNGAISSVGKAAQQVALACAVVAVEIGLLCTVSSYDCHTLAQDSFTIHVAAEEILPGMIGPNRTTTTFGSIYQNKVDGEPGADVLHVDNIACTDITDGSCGECAPQGTVAAASMPGIGSRRRLVSVMPRRGG